MDKIREIIQYLLAISDDDMPEGENYEGFTDEQLAEARRLSVEKFTKERESRDVTSAIASVEVVEAIKAEIDSRATSAAEVDSQLAELDARVVVEEPDPDPEPDPVPDEPVTTDPPAELVVETPPAEPVKEKVAIAADAKPAAPAKPAKPAPKPVPAHTKAAVATPTPKVVILAAGDVKDHSAGSTMSTDELGPAFVTKSEAARKSNSNSRLDVATIKVDYDDNRSLSDRDSIITNTEKINAVIASAQVETAKHLQAILAATETTTLQSLTAAGGLCAPVNVRYEIFQLGTDARPLRDGLLRFGATRGGIRFNSPPVLSDVTGAVNLITEAQDAASSTYPKDCIRVDCGDDNEVKVSAISLCMEVGNFQKLSFPENFAAWWRLGQVEHARVAETMLWDGMSNLSLLVTTGKHFGAARDVLAGIGKAAEQYRDRFRVAPETPLRAYVPSWLVTMMQVDILRQFPTSAPLVPARGEIARWLAAFNIAATFVLDGQPAGGVNNYYQPVGGLNPWPDDADVILAAEGTFLHLDMGSLDFGTEIRDFSQIRQNDSGAFMETFENVARVGPQAIKIRFAEICPDGTSSDGDNTVDTCASDINS